MGLARPLSCLIIVTIVGVVILGTVVSGGVLDLAGAETGNDPTAISSCTSITEPGEYELTQDIAADSSEDACIVIDLEGDVVIDGQGHSIGGGIDADPHSEEDIVVTLVLRDTTVDFIRYPSGVFDGPGASGFLENVMVGTLDMSRAEGLTIESSHVEDGIPTGFSAVDVTLRNSTFEGQVVFDENAGNFEVVNNTFTETLAFFESLDDSRIADNTFQSSLILSDAGGGPSDVVIENNSFTVPADQRPAIEFEGGEDSVIRNNVIVVEGGEGGKTPETDGIFLAHGSQNVIQGNVIQGANNGLFLIDESDSRIVDNTLTDNQIGVKVNSREQVTFERNVISNNAEFGVQNIEEEFVFDARHNYWGATDGPSSAPADDPDAPFADPETGALANGSGDAVSEGETDGVSNVRFDPFLTAPPDETTERERPNETDDRERFYQVDFVAGDVIETFGPADSDQFYSDQRRLIRFLHGSTTEPVERTGKPPTLADDISSCIDVESFDVSDDTATLRYTVDEGCTILPSVRVALVSYEKPGPGWSRANASEQRLVDVDRASHSEPGTFEVTVSLPTNATTTETESISRFP